MANIFDLSLEYISILDELEENGGELTDDIQDRLNINKDELDTKLENYRRLILSIQGEIGVLEEERERLAKKVITKEKIIDRLKENMATAINVYGEINPKAKTNNKFISTPFAKFTFVHTNPVIIDPSLEITPTNESLLPYLNASFLITAKGKDILLIKEKLKKGELLDNVKDTYSIMKKEIKSALEELEPLIDPETGEQQVDTETGELCWYKKFQDDIYIDTSAGYIRM